MAHWNQRDEKRDKQREQSELDGVFKKRHRRNSQSELERERREAKDLQRAIEREFDNEDTEESLLD